MTTDPKAPLPDHYRKALDEFTGDSICEKIGRYPVQLLSLRHFDIICSALRIAEGITKLSKAENDICERAVFKEEKSSWWSWKDLRCPNGDFRTAFDAFPTYEQALADAKMCFIGNRKQSFSSINAEREMGNLRAHIAAQAEKIAELEADNKRMREALENIAIYGCGMLSIPAGANMPEAQWLKMRLNEYEKVAYTALAQTEVK